MILCTTTGICYFTTMGGTHFLYETHVETLYHWQSSSEQSKRWKDLEEGEGYIPVLYSKVNKDMALLAKEAAKETYRQIGTRDSPGRLWIDSTDEQSIKDTIIVPYEEWWRAIQLTYVTWRSTFCALHVHEKNIKIVKVPNKPDEYQLHISVANLEPMAPASNIRINYQVKGDINLHGKASVTGTIAPKGGSGWFPVGPTFKTNDIRNCSGTITIEIEGYYNNKIPDSGYKLVQYDLANIGYEAFQVPYVLQEPKDYGVRILERDPYYFDVKIKSGGKPNSSLMANLIVHQIPAPGKWVSRGDTIELTVMDKYQQNNLVPDDNQTPEDSSDTPPASGHREEESAPGIDEEDECPTDPNKTKPGVCGCNAPEDDTDSDKDSTPDCIDECPKNPELTKKGENGCEDQIIVPDVEKQSVDNAIGILKAVDLGFTPVGGDPAPTRALSGHIQKQEPESGMMAPKSKRVKLTIYSDVQIPDVRGMNAASAGEKLKKAGFSMIPAGGDPAPEKELSLRAQSQKPKEKSPGKDVDRVMVTFYAEFGEQLVVPSILNVSLSEAQGILGDVGLTLDPVFKWGERATSKEQVGAIHSQIPEEGEPIEPGGQITAWIYYTVVPKVLGNPFKDATSDLAAAWFDPHWKWGDIVTNKDQWYRVQSQSLEAGEKVKEAGLPVNLEVFKKPGQEDNPYHRLIGHWEGFNQKEKTKIKAIIHLEILSVNPDGVIQGKFITPEQVVQLHNAAKGTMTIKRKEMPVSGTVKGDKISLSYKIVSGKGRSHGIWQADNQTIKGTNSISSKLLQGGKWHSNGVNFTLEKK